MKFKGFLETQPFTIYIFLTFVISWGLILVLAGPENIPLDIEKSKEILPLLYVSMLFGPSVAGLLVIGCLGGRCGLRSLLLTFFHWKVRFSWYLIALFVTPILAVAILTILSFFSSEFQTGLFYSDHITETLLSGIVAGVMVGIFEEIGWTGFAVPRLLRRYNFVASGLLIGIIWGLWHFILFWEQDSFKDAFAFLLLLGKLLFWLPPFRILMIWIYKKTNSLLLVFMSHMSLVFTTTVIVPESLAGYSLLTWIVTWGVVLWVLVLFISVYEPIGFSDSSSAKDSI